MKIRKDGGDWDSRSGMSPFRLRKRDADVSDWDHLDALRGPCEMDRRIEQKEVRKKE